MESPAKKITESMKTIFANLKNIAIKNIAKNKTAPQGPANPIDKKKENLNSYAKREQKKHRLKAYMDLAGINIEYDQIKKYILNISIAINLVISAYLLYYFLTNQFYSIFYILYVMALVWTLLLIIIIFVLWGIFHFMIDVRIYQRKVAIEEVLPDFLSLTSANVRAGMTIDRALWFAVRPKFGVLAKEIEICAKQTMSGEDLETALQSFAAKYDSQTLKRSISLLVEGIRAGGEIGDLLNKISINIKDNQLLRKEMSANVTTYVIFITFSTIIAAPFLFGLSYQLLKNIQNVMSSINIPASTNVMGFSIGAGVGVSLSQFRVFAILSLLVTSFFSSILVATIKKGDLKAGIKYIPMFMICSVTVFLLASFLMSKLFGNMF